MFSLRGHDHHESRCRLQFHSSWKCMRRWIGLGGHLFLPETELVLLPSSLPRMTGWLRGMWRSSPVERVIAVQLCPRRDAALWGNLRLPSRACGFSSVSTAEAYRAAGQAASALHDMALLLAYQALKQFHEGSFEPGLMQELRKVTDLGLRVTKVRAWSLVPTRSTLVVQVHYLWLNLADIKESDKHHILNSQAGLFSDAVESMTMFSATQQWTEVIRQQSLPWRAAALATPALDTAPQRAHRWGRPPAASTSYSVRPQQQPLYRLQLGAGSDRSQLSLITVHRLQA